MPAALALASLVGLLAFAKVSPEPLLVEWKAHAACPDVNVFWSALVSRSDAVRRAKTGEPGRKVSVEITTNAKGSVGKIAVEGSEPRTIAAATCSEAVDAMAIVVALLLDPSASASARAATPDAGTSPAGATEGTSATPPPREEPPRSPPAAAPPAPTSSSAAPPRTWVVSIGGGADVFAAGDAGAVLTTPISIELAREVAIRLNLARGRSGTVQNERGPSARFVWSTARVDVCTGRSRRIVAFSPCLAVEAGSLAGEPVVTDRPQSDQRLWMATHLLGRGSLALGSTFSLELEAGAAVALTRPEFYVDPDFFLYRPSPILFHARAGLMVHFP